MALAIAVGLTTPAALPASPPPSYLSELIQQARDKKLSATRGWQRLLHYQKTWTGGVESEADAPAFFIAADGKTNPESELEAALESFFQDPGTVESGKMHPQCSFPARYKWLKRQLQFDPARLPEQPCLRLDRWIKKLDPHSVTLVFASYYMNNPSSMFGHTLLRIDSQSKSKHKKLLNYGVNYAANPDTDNPILYALRGIGGYFKGVFTVFPYSLKVQEYNNWESRDLWEYELNLDKDKMDTLLRHLWELGEIYFDYYYLQENCSYHMLTVLEAADPDLHLTDDIFWSVIPADTIKALVHQPGLVSKVVYRPAILSKMNHKIEQMSNAEKDVLYEIVDDEQTLHDDEFQALKVPQKALVLDALLDYKEHLYVQERVRDPTKPITIPRELLLERSKLKFKRQDTEITRFSTPPEEGHDTDRFRLALGTNNDELFQEFGYRPVLHDLLARETGYDRHSQILMMDGRYRYYYESKRIRVERFQLLDIITLTPFEPIFKRPSWKMSLGFDRIRDLDCGYCLGFGGTSGGGLTYHPSWFSPFMAFALAEVDGQTSGHLDDNYRVGGGGSTGIFIDWGEDWRLLLGAEYKHFPLGHKSQFVKFTAQQRYAISQNVDLRLEYNRVEDTDEGILALNLYF